MKATLLGFTVKARGNLVLASLALLLWPLLMIARSGETNDPASEATTFHVGMSRACFQNVNRNDAVAAYRVFLENSGRRFGNRYRADPQVFEDAATFEAAIQQTPIHMAVIDAWQYVHMDIRRTMKPFFAVMGDGRVGRKYLVLTRHDSGLRTLAEMRGKAILELELISANAGRVWLDTRLLSENRDPGHVLRHRGSGG